jgi:hypothetical protein
MKLISNALVTLVALSGNALARDKAKHPKKEQTKSAPSERTLPPGGNPMPAH